MTPDGSSQPLAEVLRAATAAAHTAAERSTFVQRLFRGALPRDAYVAYIRSLHPVYGALEEALRASRGNLMVASIWDPALERTRGLEEDLVFFAGPQWSGLPVVAPAAEYVEHVRALAAEAPLHLVAHAYVRYLGDLSGGQMIGPRVAALYDVGEAGTNFYAFREVTDIGARKQAYRAALSALPLSPAETDTFVGEARLGFEFARRIFEALDQTFPPT